MQLKSILVKDKVTFILRNQFGGCRVPVKVKKKTKGPEYQ